MSDPTQRLIAILQHYMPDPARLIAAATTLNDLGIDKLDLPMIVIDVEDAFSVDIPYRAEIEDLSLVQDLLAFLATEIARPRPRPTVRQVKSNWMSTGTSRR